jgi:hypothetical protein
VPGACVTFCVGWEKGVSAWLEVGYKGLCLWDWGKEREWKGDKVLVLMLMCKCSVAILEFAQDKRGIA